MRETVALRCSKPPKPINLSLILAPYFCCNQKVGEKYKLKIDHLLQNAATAMFCCTYFDRFTCVFVSEFGRIST